MTSDRAEIRDLVERYAAGADRADGEAVAALFAEDGEAVLYLDPALDEPTSQRRGRAQISASIAKIRDFNATYHSIGSHVVEIEGDAARGETRCEAHHLIGKPPSLRDYTMFIRYLDEFARIDGQWCIRRRELRVLWIAISPVENT